MFIPLQRLYGLFRRPSNSCQTHTHTSFVDVKIQIGNAKLSSHAHNNHIVSSYFRCSSKKYALDELSSTHEKYIYAENWFLHTFFFHLPPIYRMEYKYIWTNNVQTCIICKHDENQTGNISLQSNYNAIIDGSGIFFRLLLWFDIPKTRLKLKCIVLFSM